jgi:hypothetical protein
MCQYIEFVADRLVAALGKLHPCRNRLTLTNIFRLSQNLLRQKSLRLDGAHLAPRESQYVLTSNLTLAA